MECGVADIAQQPKGSGKAWSDQQFRLNMNGLSLDARMLSSWAAKIR